MLPAEPRKYIPGGRRSQLMDLIQSIVGEKAINRDHNKDMTDEDHEDFWNNAYRGRGDYRAFLERCAMRRRIRELEARVRDASEGSPKAAAAGQPDGEALRTGTPKTEQP